MSLPPLNRADGTKAAIETVADGVETLALNFYENTPVNNKVLFVVTPQTWDWEVSKIAYNFGGTDLSANGYIQLIVSRVQNPNVYGVLDSNSNILLSKMGGANRYVEGEAEFKLPMIMHQNEAHYIYLISNIPPGANMGVLGRLTFYFKPLYR